MAERPHCDRPQGHHAKCVARRRARCRAGSSRRRGRSIGADLPRRARSRREICRAGLSYERARGLHLTLRSTPPFGARSTRSRYCGVRRVGWCSYCRDGGGRSYRARREERRANLEARAWRARPRLALPCGNISPLGVTGAPVIDESTPRSISTPRSCARMRRATKSTRFRSPTVGRTRLAGRCRNGARRQLHGRVAEPARRAGAVRRQGLRAL